MHIDSPRRGPALAIALLAALIGLGGLSTAARAATLTWSAGDLIWLDLNNNGTYQHGIDKPAPAGVQVNLYLIKPIVGAQLAGTVYTNENGRWVVNGLLAGRYLAQVPASEFAAGARLAGYQAQALGFSSTPDLNLNEDVDHHTRNDGVPGVGAISTAGNLTFVSNGTIGGEPLNDNLGGLVFDPPVADDFTNLTLDIALVSMTTQTLTLAVGAQAASAAVALDPAANWLLSAQAPGLAQISGLGGGNGAAVADATYSLSAGLSGSTAMLEYPADTAWACAYADGTALPTGSWSAAGSLTMPRGRDVTCTFAPQFPESPSVEPVIPRLELPLTGAGSGGAAQSFWLGGVALLTLAGAGLIARNLQRKKSGPP